MAHFVEQYIHAIQRCEDYDMLAAELDSCISNNVINHVSSDAIKAIDKLNVDSQVTKFIKTMVWAVTVSDHTETCLNILKYFCNKVSTQIDSLLFDLDDYSLLIIAICADDKHFIERLSNENKIKIAYALTESKLVYYTSDSEKENKFIIDKYFIESIDLILHNYTMEELDRKFDDLYKKANDDSNIDHFTNRVIRPFQAIFINVVQNMDQRRLLEEICVEEWEKRVFSDIKNIASKYAVKFKDETNRDYYYTFLHDFVLTCHQFNKELSKTGYTNIVNPVVGRFIFAIMNGLHHIYSCDTISPEKIKLLMRDGLQIIHEHFAFSHESSNIIAHVVDAYCESGKLEDIFLEGEYFKAIKAHLKNDEMINVWVLANMPEFANNPYGDRVYATYLHCYMNPMISNADELLNKPATEANSEESDNNEDNRIDDEEESDSEQEQREDEEDSDNSDIEASQSNKGYKKSSSAQAKAERKIYGAYKTYKDNESKVDSQLTKMLNSAKKAFTKDETEAILEGKRFTPLGLLKKIFLTAAIFSYSKIAGFIYLLTSHTLSKKRTMKQKTEILIQIETEINMLDEKIEDARGDGNRKAKYALMRTRNELIRARDKIKYNLTATKEDLKTAKSYIENRRGEEYERRM